MEKYSVTSPWELRQLCLDNNWFTCGTIEQFEKLCYANENGCPIEEIATIIWLCSNEECRRTDVLDILNDIHKLHILSVIAENGDGDKLLLNTVEEVYNGHFE